MQPQIKVILWDLDGTLIRTMQAFDDCLGKLQADLAQQLEIAVEVFTDQFLQVTTESRKLHYVNPTPFWSHTVAELIKLYPTLSTLQDEILNRIHAEIYYVDIPLRPGALEALIFAQSLGLRQALVTHAEDDWTWRKLRSAGLDSVFHPQNVFTVPVSGKKTTQHWKEALDRLGYSPQEALFIGDDPSGDIIPALELNAQAIWCPDPSKKHPHLLSRAEEVMGRVPEITDLSQLPNAIMQIVESSEPRLPPLK